jgi:hypothetical protein
MPCQGGRRHIPIDIETISGYGFRNKHIRVKGSPVEAIAGVRGLELALAHPRIILLINYIIYKCPINKTAFPFLSFLIYLRDFLDGPSSYYYALDIGQEDRTPFLLIHSYTRKECRYL